MEHKIDDILQGVFAEMRREKPQRQLVLHTEPEPAQNAEPGRPKRQVRRLVALRLAVAVTGIAAAIVAGIFLLVPTGRSHSDDIVCYVNGTRIVDRQEAIEYTREAFGIVGASLERSAGQISSTMGRVGEILGGHHNGTKTETEEK